MLCSVFRSLTSLTKASKTLDNLVPVVGTRPGGQNILSGSLADPAAGHLPSASVRDLATDDAFTEDASTFHSWRRLLLT